MRVIPLLMAAVLLAGCAESTSSEPAAQADPVAPNSASSAGVAVDAAPAANNTTVGGIRITATGEAGSWLIAHQLFPETLEELDTETTYKVTTSGPTQALWIEPRPSRAMDGGWGRPWLSPFQERMLLDEPDGMSLERSYGSGYGGQFAGMFVAMAADQPWTLDVSVRWGEGELVTPEQLFSGDGATFVMGAEHVGAGAGVGQASLDATVTPGWTHLEAVATKLQPTAVRSYQFSLANGHSASGISTTTGYYVPVLVGGSASASNAISYIGSFNNTAGPIRAEVTFAEPSIDVDIGYAHIPVGHLPGLVGADYEGNAWPFHDVV